MNYIYTNLEDFRHQKEFMQKYKQKVYSLLYYYDEENFGEYDILINLLNEIREVL